MTTQPHVGLNYLYNGPIASHAGRVGVASGVRQCGKLWLVNLANHKEWGAAGIEPVLYEVLSSELEPAPAEPADVILPKAPRTRPLPVPTPTPKEVVQVGYPATVLQEPEPGNFVGPPVAPDAYKGPEDELAQDCQNWLTRNGFRSAVVGQLKAKGSGTTVGYPDLSFRRAEWPRGFWVLVELKNAEGSLSDEQFTLWEAGGSFVVRSVRELALVARRGEALASVMIAAEKLSQIAVF